MPDAGRTKCSSLIFTLGLTALFLWLSLRPSEPKCSISHFYLPTLNEPDNNTTLFFGLTLENPNKDNGIYYDDVKVNVTVLGAAKSGSHFVGNTTITRFYQGFKKTAEKQGQVSYNKTVVAADVFANGTAVFQVDVATAVRYKYVPWKTKRRGFKAVKKVVINENGTMVNAAKKMDFPLILVMINLLVLNLLSF